MNWFLRGIRSQFSRKPSRVDRGKRRRPLAIESLEDRRLLVVLTDFGLTVGVDGYGSFGFFVNGTGTSDAFIRGRLTTDEAAVLIGYDTTGGAVVDQRQFLSTGCIDRYALAPDCPAGGGLNGNLPDPIIDQQSPTLVASLFDFPGNPFLGDLQVALTQDLQPLPPGADGVMVPYTGALLQQSYTITNTNPNNAFSGDFVKYFDGGFTRLAGNGELGRYQRTSAPVAPIEYLVFHEEFANGEVGNALLGNVPAQFRLEMDDTRSLINKITLGALPDDQIGTLPVGTNSRVPQTGDLRFVDPPGNASIWRSLLDIPPSGTQTVNVLTTFVLPLAVGGSAFDDFPQTIDEVIDPPALPTISGVKFQDLNRNGLQESNEPGLGNWQIELYRLQAGGDPTNPADLTPVDSIPTGTDGRYNFGSQLSGDYVIREVLTGQPGYSQTGPNLNTPVASNVMVVQDAFDPAPDRMAYKVSLSFDDSFFGAFGNIRPNISGQKFHDLDGNGRLSQGDAFLNGWTIELYRAGPDGAFDPINPGGDDTLVSSQTTGSLGQTGGYEFNNINVPGGLVDNATYYIREVLKPNWTETFPSSKFHVVTFRNGGVFGGNNFGNVKVGNLGGVKFLDLNENGARNAGEPGVGSPQIRIYIDRNNNGRWDGPNSGEEFGLTQPDGSWTIPNVPLVRGVVTIREELPTPTDLWVQTFPGSDRDFAHKVDLLARKEVLTNLKFGNKGFARVTGKVFDDMAPNKPGLGDFYVWLDLDNDGRPNIGEPGTFSKPGGTYDLSPVDPVDPKTGKLFVGTVPLRSIPQNGWTSSAPAPAVHNVSIQPGAVVNNQNFGNVPNRGTSSPATPASYGVATHGIVPNVQLGPINGVADGVEFLTKVTGGVDAGRGVVTVGGTESIKVTFGPAQPIVGAKLSAWVDSDLSGTFEADEQVLRDVIYGTTSAVIPVTLPAQILPPGVNNTYMRFRLSYQKGLGPVGATGAGEPEDYPVRIRRPGDSIAAAVNSVVELGDVGDVTRMDESIAGTSYGATAAQTGLFSVTAAFDQADGDVSFAIYDRKSGAKIVSSGDYAKGAKAVIFDSTKGEQYKIAFTGNNPKVDLHFQNMIMVNSPATVVGTDGNDVFRFVAGTKTHVLTVNGVDYRFDAATNKKFTVLGNGGDDSITVTSLAGNDLANFRPRLLKLNGDKYDLVVRDVEDIELDAAGGKNRLVLVDSKTDDVLTAGPSGLENVKFSADGFSITASYINRLYAYSRSGGNDLATLTGTNGNDKLISKPDRTVFRGANLFSAVTGFAKVDVSAKGGYDSAVFYDSSDDDDITAAPGHFNIRGKEFSNSGDGFDLIRVKSTAADNDTATLIDSSGKDQLNMWPNVARFFGPGFRYIFHEIEDITAESTHGGNDVVQFYGSSGNDTIVAAPNDILFTGNGFSRAAKGFARNSINSTQGGHDTAIISDSAADDVFSGRKSIFKLTSSGSFIYGRGFSKVTLYGSTGTNTIAELKSLDYLFSKTDDWIGP